MISMDSKSPSESSLIEDSLQQQSSSTSSPPKRFSLEKPFNQLNINGASNNNEFDTISSNNYNSNNNNNGITLAKQIQIIEENFINLQSPDLNTRVQGVETIIGLLSNPDNEKLVKTYLNNIIVLANQCPFPEIYEPFKTFLASIQDNYFTLKQRASLFSNEKLPGLETNDELTKRLFQEVFLRDGKVSHLVRVLGWHPNYLEKFIMVYNNVMRDPGPLPIAWRNYIGILASARYNCHYMVTFQEKEFLLNNGDPKWLQGIDHIPTKLKNLLNVIQLMAHQPWLLPQLDIEYLVKGPDAWSIAELVHAMVLICTFLSLSGLVFCCGITPELQLSDCNNINQNNNNNNNNNSLNFNNNNNNNQNNNNNNNNNNNINCLNVSMDSDCDVEDISSLEDTEKVMELLKKRKNSADEEDEDDTMESNIRQQNFHNAGIESENNSVGYQSPQFPSGCDQGKRDTTPLNQTMNTTTSTTSNATSVHHLLPQLSNIQPTNIDLSRYIGSYNLSHQDFDVSSREYTTFSVQEYSWKDHGYELISRYFPDAAPLLDEEFEFVYTMTYFKFNGNPDIDTLPFRRAIWYYVQRVKGMCHDDYNYKEVNDFLTKNLKYFVKKAVCFPQKITKSDYSTLGYNLTPDEKCHVSLLAICSHKQATLLYGLYTVMAYQNRR